MVMTLQEVIWARLVADIVSRSPFQAARLREVLSPGHHRRV